MGINTLSACFFVVLLAPPAPAEEILTAVAGSSATRHAATYSGMRRYTMHNLRYGKTASVTVRMESTPDEGKIFTIVDRSGSTTLIGVIEKLLASEAESSRPGTAGGHEIGPSNYKASMRGSETVSGRDCFVLELTPKAKSKYLVSGKAWIDKATGGLVRLDGTTTASVSVWVGSPHIVEDFAPVNGVWLPMHMVSTSSSLLLGESSLDIRYTEYNVEAPNTVRQR